MPRCYSRMDRPPTRGWESRKHPHSRGRSWRIGASTNPCKLLPSMRFPRVGNSNRQTCYCNARHKWHRLSPRTRHGLPRADPRRLECTFPCCCRKSGIVPCSPNRSKCRRQMSSGSTHTRPPSRTCFQFRSPSSAGNCPQRHSIGLWGKKLTYRPRGTFRYCRWRTNQLSMSMGSGWGKYHCRYRPIRAYVDRLSNSRLGIP